MKRKYPTWTTADGGLSRGRHSRACPHREVTWSDTRSFAKLTLTCDGTSLPAHVRVLRPPTVGCCQRELTQRFLDSLRILIPVGENKTLYYCFKFAFQSSCTKPPSVLLHSLGLRVGRFHRWCIIGGEHELDRATVCLTNTPRAWPNDKVGGGRVPFCSAFVHACMSDALHASPWHPSLPTSSCLSTGWLLAKILQSGHACMAFLCCDQCTLTCVKARRRRLALGC